ncbi:MAG: TIGR01459 family HAD-type hydrolase [Rhodospirillaceae bacterium]|jgi:HAD superfamily hydrolase (TIGR01459 family)|nr:TIGR01459 family HAD-type hydrolase [Rhodospirillaceae bacterium]MBT4045936.1 TIGR01459 family HAD-type hydrolase [Rhodospirillaceae bacterium]MBT4687133.1 TIGR01459 family HAD-type hydrolase [Rhodospirillaceae bacterium]MBT5081323.1 TIGR01459 family HAD-type hydrolase [Rhodospirillaceae bacterium]MBT5522807.1 TIGR01459 family HAD-type hydrolase [Rhodospirillaceae bacterium]
MSITIINGLAELADQYDLFIFDLWGVVHDGVAAYPNAADCLQRLRQGGGRVVLLSNAPRPSASVAQHLAELGVSKDLYDWLLTSGEATANAIAATASGSGGTARPAYYHLGPERNRPTLEACGGREVAIDAAEMIICTGFFDDETETAEDYRDFLTAAAARGLPLICANPDVVVMRGEQMIPCAGALAALYEQLGGTVQRYGKPFPAIFDLLFAETPHIPRHRAVMVGDGLPTDIRGARRAGINAIWIAGGIHATDLALGPNGELEAEKVHSVAEQADEQPLAIMPWLQWSSEIRQR